MSREVPCVPREDMPKLMSGAPERRDIIVTVRAARRRRAIEQSDAALALIGSEVRRDIRQVAGFAARNHIPCREIEVGSEELRALAAVCGIKAAAPGVVFGRDHWIEPATPRGALALGPELAVGSGAVFDVRVVGTGPAGGAAGVWRGLRGWW